MGGISAEEMANNLSRAMRARQTKEKAIEKKPKTDYWRCDCCGGTNKNTDKICSWCRSGKVVTPSKK